MTVHEVPETERDLYAVVYADPSRRDGMDKWAETPDGSVRLEWSSVNGPSGPIPVVQVWLNDALRLEVPFHNVLTVLYNGDFKRVA